MKSEDIKNGFYTCIIKEYPNDEFKVKVQYRGDNRTRITFPKGNPVIEECGYSKIYFTNNFLDVYKLLDYIRPINDTEL